MVFSFGAGLGSTPATWLVILSPIVAIGILSVKNFISNIIMEVVMNPSRQTLTANVIASTLTAIVEHVASQVAEGFCGSTPSEAD